MGWHGVADATPKQQGASILPPHGIFYKFSNRWFVFATKERSPEIVVELKLGLCGIQKAQSFPFHTLSILSI